MGEGKRTASERTEEQKTVLQSVQLNGQKPILLPSSYSLKSGSLEFKFKDHEFSSFMALGFEIILNAARWFTASSYMFFWITNFVIVTNQWNFTVNLHQRQFLQLTQV